jgi:nucleoside recognition membrane protein YjiH
MKKNQSLWFVLFLIIGVAVFMYLVNKKDKNRYISDMLTTSPEEINGLA